MLTSSDPPTLLPTTEFLLTPPDLLEFFRKARADPLFSRLPSIGEGTREDVPTSEISMREETAHEHIRLQILAKQRDFRTHSSAPWAMASEIDRPSAGNFGSLPTRTGPSPSRENHRALAAR